MTTPKRVRLPISAMSQILCSIVGTCLTLKETEKIARRFGYSGDPSPHQLHIWAVEACKKVPEVGKYLQKYLSGKYRLAMKRLDAYEGKDLLRAWKDAVREGRIAGAYWAILTRMDAPDEVFTRVFGEVHMMSHLQGAEVRSELKELDGLRQDYCGQKERINKLQAQSGKVSREREQLQHRLSAKEGEISQVKHKLRQTEKCLLSLTQGGDLERLRAENRVLLQQLASEKRLREKLEMRLFQETVRQLPSMYPAPPVQDAPFEAGGSPEETCPLANGEKCRRFCNKLILLVGGPERRESHYRRLVEQDFGGIFLRHDGDCRNGQARLVNLVKQAEVVICPISCTSHQAYHCAKKWCKKLNKPCVLMHNTGVGALTRTLMELAHPQGTSWEPGVCEDAGGHRKMT